MSATLMRLLDVIWLFALLPSTLLAALLLTQRHDGGTMICGVSMAIWYLLAIAALSWMNTDMVPWDWLAVVNIWSKRLPMALTVGAVFGATFRSRLRVA
ncbi:hypothetical protein AACH06_06830 [Ideonella sp. DXS29W]|uniref:Uncharacterized protein n=1 Tax=Ideonella lacteola TaxID=2984193 RepID=A0ABU9BKQ1_9BURK